MQNPVSYTHLVQGILDDVKERGDEAVFSYTKQFDGAQITAETVRVTREEQEAAFAQICLLYTSGLLSGGDCMNTRISVRTATIKWELRKRLEICWRPFLLMTAILAVHALSLIHI